MRYALIVLLASGIDGAVAPVVDAQNVAQRALPSVVTLRTYDTSGDEVLLGSGFTLEDGRVATNTHVLDGAAWVEVLGADGSSVGTLNYAEALSTNFDLAILPTVSGAGSGLTLATAPPEIGESVWVIGSPQGLQGSVSDGVVSAIRELDGIRLIQISAPVSQGSSGGPVLNESGEVVAVAVGLIPSGQNLNFGVAVRHLKTLAEGPAGYFTFPKGDRERPRQKPEEEERLPPGVVRMTPDDEAPSGSKLPEWIYVGDANDDHWFIQGKGRVVDGEVVLVWVWLAYSEPEKMRGHRLPTVVTKAHYAYDCPRRLGRTLRVVHYDAFGEPLGSNDWSDSGWRGYSPGSIGASNLEVACQLVDLEPYLTALPPRPTEATKVQQRYPPEFLLPQTYLLPDLELFLELRDTVP